jgi:hypothetical protein
MRTKWMGVAVVVSLGLAGVAARPAMAAAGSRVVESLKSKRGGPSVKRSQLKRAPKPSRTARVKNFFLRPFRGLKPINRKQHAYAPIKPGDTRVFDIVTSNGVETTSTSMLTQRVSDVRIQDGRLRAQVEQIWEMDGHSSTTLHVQDVSKDGMLMSTAEKLDEPPKVPIRVEGVGLPKELSPGKTWSNRMSWEANGATVDWSSQGRVVRKVRQAGPDRTMRDGVEVEMVSRNTSTINGQVHKTTTIMRAIYLKGIGEVESTSRTEGQLGSVTRRLVGFTPGGDPG